MKSDSKLSRYLQSASSSLIDYAKDWLSNISNKLGLGAIPFLIPVLIIGATALVAAYAVATYGEITRQHNTEALALAKQFGKDNPDLAKRFIDGAVKAGGGGIGGTVKAIGIGVLALVAAKVGWDIYQSSR